MMTAQQEAEKQLADVLAWDAMPTPDESSANWAKWHRPDGGCVIFRANFRGDWGTLDTYWREPDGS